MTERALDTAVASAAALLTHYCFELGGYTAEQLIDRWLKDYDACWVRLAVIEALYQGRYKAVSVAQILACWKRRGNALYHFNGDFERLVCRNFPDRLTAQSALRPANSSVPAAVVSPSRGDAAFALNQEPSVTGGQQEEPEAQQSQSSLELSALISGEESDWIEEVKTTSVPSVTGASSADSLPVGSTGSAAPAQPLPLLQQLPQSGFSHSSAPIPKRMGKTLANLVRLATQVSEQALLDEPVPPPKTKEAPSEWKPKKVPKVEYQADWSRWQAIRNPIVRFTPAVEFSEFHAKLKAVAQQPEDSAADTAGTTSVTELDVEIGCNQTGVPVEE